jgi:hypothetical protein
VPTPRAADWPGPFARTVAALADCVVRTLLQETSGRSTDDSVRFALAQHGRMPTHLRLPVRLATLAFDWSGALRRGRPFHADGPAARDARLARWRIARLAPCRDLIRFWESLIVYGWFSAPDSVDGP